MSKPEQPEWDGIAEKWLEKESVRVSVLTDLQTLIKEIISSRDTYWKERVRKEVEGMRVTKKNAQELAHTPLCRQNPEKGNNHFFCSITNADYFRNQALDTLLDNLK